MNVFFFFFFFLLLSLHMLHTGPPSIPHCRLSNVTYGSNANERFKLGRDYVGGIVTSHKCCGDIEAMRKGGQPSKVEPNYES